MIEKRSLAFDVINGGLGFLEACFLARSLILANRAKVVMVATSEVENNSSTLPDRLRGIRETGAAVLLDASADNDVGFGAFAFRSFPEHASALSVYGSARSLHNGDRYLPHLVVEQDPQLDRLYAQCAVSSTEAFLETQHLDTNDIAVFLPPQLSARFVDLFAEMLEVERERCVDVTSQDGDLFTAAVPLCWPEVAKNGTVGHGDLGLIVNVAAGLEVGCATYHF